MLDFDDPDNFTHTLFHSVGGVHRTYFSTPEADEILEGARAETQPSARQLAYRRFEHLLLDSGSLIPLFHDVGYRLASPKIRGVRLSSVSPFVNYSELGKARDGGNG